MMQTMKRGLALFLVLVMFVAFVPTLILNVDAAEVNYVYNGKYIYNWGTRGTVATFLSPNAEAFYEKTQSYEELAANAGGTGKSDAPSSALYKALQNLMKNAQTHQTSYAETRDLYMYTDCQNNGGKISSFYSGKDIGPSWDSGGTWNREHTWPNSKGLGGNDENDIMMLRPTATSENGARGNKAYGQSSGYYFPNVESGGKYDVRGDVARIFLYVYVRWGNLNYAWGTSGVMESVDVLLLWMEEDPVDTWELGRNDSVESITGTRNVFVDYPELAFLLFGEEIPADMETPSGGSDNKCAHNNFGTGTVTAPTCTEKGYTTLTCKTAGCGYSYKTNTVPAKGHSFVNGTCSVCGETETQKPTYATEIVPGQAYKLGMFSTANQAEYYFTGTMSGYYGATDTACENGVDVYAEQVSGGYRLYFKNDGGQKQYINLVKSGTHFNFTFAASATSTFTWDAAESSFWTTVEGERCYMGTFGSYVTVGVLQASKHQDTDYIARFYTTGGSSSGGSSSGGTDTPTTCQHNYTSVITTATCTTDGYTTYTCTLCKHSYTDNKVAAKGHTYSNGTCIRCGATKPSSTEVTISFADTANRTVLSKEQQVWVQNGITVTNNKANSQSDVADYCNPARFYQGSEVIIEYPGMTKIVIDCTGAESKHVESWVTSTTNATATSSGKTVTITFDAPVDSFTISSLAKQARASSITVYAEGASGECEHANLKTEGKTDATCTTAGHTGTITCTDCGEVLDNGDVIAALGHNDADNDGICDVCNKRISDSDSGSKPEANEHIFAAWVIIRKPTCTSAGLERRDCDHCSDYETRDIPAIGHKDDNDDKICDVCGGDSTIANAEHTCRELSFFERILTAIVNFIRGLLGQPQTCPCGEIILEKKN